MQLESKPMTVGAHIVYACQGAKNVLWKDGEVCALNEHVQAVKILFFRGANEKKTGHCVWLPLKDIRWSPPETAK